MSLTIDASRHMSTRHFAPLFGYEHLQQGPVQQTSRVLAEVAQVLVNELPDGPELSAGLRKLLEAKDCFVRAVILDQLAAE